MTQRKRRGVSVSLSVETLPHYSTCRSLGRSVGRSDGRLSLRLSRSVALPVCLYVHLLLCVASRRLYRDDKHIDVS